MADGAACNASTLTMCAHNGTHLDAPLHFVKDGAAIESISAETLCGPCRVVDAGDARWITQALVEAWAPRPGERLLLRTRNSALWGHSEFARDAVGLDPGGARALRDAGVALIGIDYLSVGSFAKHGVVVHHILLGAGIPLLEGLDLREAPAGEYQLVAAPLLIPGADGAPARAFLWREDEQ